MSEQSITTVEETLKIAHLGATSAKQKVDDIRAEVPILAEAEKEMATANKVKKAVEAQYRDLLNEIYQNTGELPITQYAQVGIDTTRTLKNRKVVIERIIQGVIDGDESMLSLLNLNESLLSEYPSLNAEWDIEESVDARIQWKRME